MATAINEGRRIELRGTVQGVGMRPWVYRLAAERGVAGRVWNHATGVTIDAFGSTESLDAFVAALRTEPPPAAVMDDIVSSAIAPEPLEHFAIVESRRQAGRRASIPADLATCPQCLTEIFDVTDHRFRYPFTNCTNCGPRFTIARGIPYDRFTTTMAPFVMCERCQREYADPANRRFHAEPNACPDCGPQLQVLSPRGEVIPLTEHADAINYAAGAIASGSIVALKGLGGFHLACDATSPTAVARLRLRKHRDEKPFAVMVRDAATAAELAVLSPDERSVLESVERPILLVRRRGWTRLAPDVAPDNPLIGLMLPYTPLHHLLLAEAGVPLVMTSANVSDEPIVYRNHDAVTRLHDIADVLLVHDREIVTRCDDSVATMIAGAPAILRRSRGFVPRALSLPITVDEPVLACGALLKNTFCIAHERWAWLGPHIGDLENVDTFDAYQDAIERMQRFLDVRPEVVAHDLHPDYLSTRYARERSARPIGVQHHHAHVAAAMAEHGLTGPVLGIAFDGTGYGTDGSAWGGEFLFGDAHAVARVATFRPVLLPGGDAAIRHPWRIALSLLRDAMGASAPVTDLPLFRSLRSTDIDVMERMLNARINTPPAHGVGRYFDGIGALIFARPDASYEGQLAFNLNMAAEPGELRRYEYAIDRSASPMEVDLRPVIGAIVADLLSGQAAGVISARFHNTLIAATAAVARDIGPRRARVVLTGGCFQNVRLTEGVVAQLRGDYDVYPHRRVPPGDGGIALGQALVAGTVQRG